jgi:transmembrane sensor
MIERHDASGSYGMEQRREAAEWFVIIYSKETPDPSVLQSWLAWLDCEEGNKRAFEAVAAAWHGMTVRSTTTFPTTEEMERDDYDGEELVSQWLAERNVSMGASFRQYANLNGRYSRRRWWRIGLAASLVAVVAGLALMFQIQEHKKTLTGEEFATHVGEKVELILADGSHVWLGPQSILRVKFTKERRNLKLLSGEAFFSVRKNANRPFIVSSSGGDITAVGTEFNVRESDGRVLVTVSEGVVAVTLGSDESLSASQVTTSAVRVASGEQVAYTPSTVGKSLQVARSPSVGDRSRWRDGILVYRDEPLGQVVLDVTRYSQRPIEVRGSELAALRYSGAVYVDAVDDWLNALTQSFPVRVINEENRTVLQWR